jgi:hypothetical protein
MGCSGTSAVSVVGTRVHDGTEKRKAPKSGERDERAPYGHPAEEIEEAEEAEEKDG